PAIHATWTSEVTRAGPMGRRVLLSDGRTLRRYDSRADTDSADASGEPRRASNASDGLAASATPRAPLVSSSASGSSTAEASAWAARKRASASAVVNQYRFWGQPPTLGGSNSTWPMFASATNNMGGTFRAPGRVSAA